MAAAVASRSPAFSAGGSCADGDIGAQSVFSFEAPRGFDAPPASSSSSFRGRRERRWAPTRRELQKYASLFLRSDRDADGFVDASEAHTICARSMLDQNLLRLAWEHADQDRDGRLSFPEFVVLVHCVTCCLAGLTLPPIERGLPSELLEAVARLEESPEELHAARSSRSASPVSSNSPSASSASRSPSPSPASGAPLSTWDRGAWEGTAAAASSSGPGGLARRTRAPGLSNAAFEDEAEDRSGRGRGRLDRQASFASDASGSASGRSSPRFGASGDHRDRAGSGSPTGRRRVEPDISRLAGQLSAITSADGRLARHAASEVDRLIAELRELRATKEQEEAEVVRSRRESDRLGELRRQLAAQVRDQRRFLSELWLRRREAAAALRSPRREQAQRDEELSFLQQTLNEEEQLLEGIRHTNSAMERSCASLAGELHDLEKRRREAQEKACAEADLMLSDRRRLAMTAPVSRVCGDDGGAGEEAAHLDFHTAGLGSLSYGFAAAAGGGDDAFADDGWGDSGAWASSLVGPSSTSLGAGFAVGVLPASARSVKEANRAPVPSPNWRAATGPAGREGV
eukprot:TRINITY_DN15174_c0_g2_i1.p1 TRINITY_DN15174_c0_g2~~TRINITY_DN15174_c0_g2_i1.p1  ORF type:complete len:574 (-),score=109.89 TRINITY_DN15174_c0_g2_i1:17-1738(-)